MLAACLLSAVLAGDAVAASGTHPDMVELALPRPPGDGEAIWVEIRAGALPRGAEIEVRTGDGARLGTVSPFGTARGQAATYTIPLPKSAIAGGRVELHLEVEEPGAPARAPMPGEVESVTLIYLPVSN
jgi:hypothetical protein